jgi:DNA-directed RNA polymerase specialized sigma24 family protein
MSDEKPPAGDNDRDSRDDRRPLRPKVNYAELGDAALIDAMRAGQARAIDEFLVRHQRLLFERVRMAGLRRSDCEEHVPDVVEEVAVLIVARRVRPTRGIGAYLTKCFFNRLADDIERRKRQRLAVHESSQDAPGRYAPGLTERAVLSAMSENTVRSSQGPDWENAPLSEPLRKLATMIEEGLSAEEEQLLAWHGQYVPLRQIASWLGVPYATAAQRSWRLRERLREMAMQYASTLPRRDRLEIAAFFDRCAVTYDRTLRQQDDDFPPRTA